MGFEPRTPRSSRKLYGLSSPAPQRERRRAYSLERGPERAPRSRSQGLAPRRTAPSPGQTAGESGHWTVPQFPPLALPAARQARLAPSPSGEPPCEVLGLGARQADPLGRKPPSPPPACLGPPAPLRARPLAATLTHYVRGSHQGPKTCWGRMRGREEEGKKGIGEEGRALARDRRVQASSPAQEEAMPRCLDSERRRWCLRPEEECVVTSPGSLALSSGHKGGEGCRVRIAASATELRQAFPSLRLCVGQTLDPELALTPPGGGEPPAAGMWLCQA